MEGLRTTFRSLLPISLSPASPLLNSAKLKIFVVLNRWTLIFSKTFSILNYTLCPVFLQLEKVSVHGAVAVFIRIKKTEREKKASGWTEAFKFPDAETRGLFCAYRIRQLVLCSAGSGAHRPGHSGEPSLEQGPDEAGCKQDEVPRLVGLAGPGAGPKHRLGPQPARRPAALTAHSSPAPGQARQPASAPHWPKKRP